MKTISAFALLFLLASFFVITSENGYAGLGPTIPGCCQTETFCFNTINPGQTCADQGDVFNVGEVCNREGVECVVPTLGCCEFGDACNPESDPVRCADDGGEFFSNEICSPKTSSCQSSSPIPSLSQWGLIALAGILGIIGFIMAIRIKKASA